MGQKIFNTVKAFLTHRQFRIIINATFSKVYPLYNGLPQGSPLSVVLFIIAFDQLSKILKNYKKIEYLMYADDVIVYTKVTDMNMAKSILLNVLNEIKEWGKTSGPNLSVEKCKMLHICTKKLFEI